MSLHTFKMNDQMKNMTAKRCALKTGKRGRGEKKRAPGEKDNDRDVDEGKCSILRRRPNFKS